MKKLLLIAVALLFVGCTEYRADPDWSTGTLTVTAKQPYKQHWYGNDVRVYAKLNGDDSLWIDNERFHLSHEVGWTAEVRYRYVSQKVPSDPASYGVYVQLPGSRSVLSFGCGTVTDLKVVTKEELLRMRDE